MARTPLPIANGFYISDSLPLSAQECTNWYVNIPQAPALSQETLFGTPGKTQLVAGKGLREVNRGAEVMAGIRYSVDGNILYRLDRTVVGDLETFASTSLGTVEGTGRVSMANNGTQLCVMVPGGKGYIFTEPSTFTEITDADFTANGNPQTVVYIDGYFAFNTDSKKFIISALNDGLSYNALDFGTAESDPDIITALVVHNNQLFIGGSTTFEAVQNIGGADFPFQRTGLFADTGISAVFSVVKSKRPTGSTGLFMFIGAGENEAVAIWEWSGNSPVKISSNAVDSLLQTFTEAEINASFAWSYAQKGAYFVGFVLPDTTITYDTITQRWHERKSQVVDDQGITQTTRDRINSVVVLNSRIIIGDSQDGRIGELDPDVYNEYGADIIRRVATQPFQNNMESFKLPYLELTMEAGVGNSDVPDPVVRMDRSLNGKTYKDPRARRIGKIGDFGHRTTWNRNGRAKRFETFRFTLSDAVKPVIIQLTADIV